MTQIRCLPGIALDQEVRSKGELAALIRKKVCPFLSDGHLMKFLERPRACECSKSACAGLVCRTVVGTTTQDFIVFNNYNVSKLLTAMLTKIQPEGQPLKKAKRTGA